MQIKLGTPLFLYLLKYSNDYEDGLGVKEKNRSIGYIYADIYEVTQLGDLTFYRISYENDKKKRIPIYSLPRQHWVSITLLTDEQKELIHQQDGHFHYSQESYDSIDAIKNPSFQETEDQKNLINPEIISASDILNSLKQLQDNHYELKDSISKSLSSIIEQVDKTSQATQDKCNSLLEISHKDESENLTLDQITKTIENLFAINNNYISNAIKPFESHIEQNNLLLAESAKNTEKLLNGLTDSFNQKLDSIEKKQAEHEKVTHRVLTATLNRASPNIVIQKTKQKTNNTQQIKQQEEQELENKPTPTLPAKKNKKIQDSDITIVDLPEPPINKDSSDLLQLTESNTDSNLPEEKEINYDIINELNNNYEDEINKTATKQTPDVIADISELEDYSSEQPSESHDEREALLDNALINENEDQNQNQNLNTTNYDFTDISLDVNSDELKNEDLINDSLNIDSNELELDAQPITSDDTGNNTLDFEIEEEIAAEVESDATAEVEINPINTDNETTEDSSIINTINNIGFDDDISQSLTPNTLTNEYLHEDENNNHPDIQESQTDNLDDSSFNVADFDILEDTSKTPNNITVNKDFYLDGKNTITLNMNALKEPVSNEPLINIADKASIKDVQEPQDTFSLDSTSGIMDELDDFISSNQSLIHKTKNNDFSPFDEFVISHILNYNNIELSEHNFFEVEDFIKYYKKKNTDSTFQTATSDQIIFIICKLLKIKFTPINKFNRPKIQKKLNTIMPAIVTENWNGSLSSITEYFTDHDVMDSVTDIDICVWLIRNNFF